MHAIRVFHVPLFALPLLAQPCPKNTFSLFFFGGGDPPPGLLLPGQSAPLFYGFAKPAVYDTCHKMERPTRAG